MPALETLLVCNILSQELRIFQILLPAPADVYALDCFAHIVVLLYRCYLSLPGWHTPMAVHLSRVWAVWLLGSWPLFVSTVHVRSKTAWWPQRCEKSKTPVSAAGKLALRQVRKLHSVFVPVAIHVVHDPHTQLNDHY